MIFQIGGMAGTVKVRREHKGEKEKSRLTDRK